MIQPNILGTSRVNHNIKIQIESPLFSCLRRFLILQLLLFERTKQRALTIYTTLIILLSNVLFFLSFSFFACFDNGNNTVCNIMETTLFAYRCLQCSIILRVVRYRTLFFQSFFQRLFLDILIKIRLRKTKPNLILH